MSDFCQADKCQHASTEEAFLCAERQRLMREVETLNVKYRLLKSLRESDMRKVLEIVESEPEYPTPIPIFRQLKLLWYSIWFGRGIVQPMMRIAVQDTKSSIASTIKMEVVAPSPKDLLTADEP